MSITLSPKQTDAQVKDMMTLFIKQYQSREMTFANLQFEMYKLWGISVDDNTWIALLAELALKGLVTRTTFEDGYQKFFIH